MFGDIMDIIEKLENLSVARCKIDNKEFKDVVNKTGILSKHLKKLGINFNKFNTFSFFDKINYISTIKYLKCPLCEYLTKDVDNKSGVFTNHINKTHDLSIDKFCEYHSSYSHLWKTHFERKIINDFIEKNDDNKIKCLECGNNFKKLTNVHLKKHNLTPSLYKIKHNIVNTCSKTTQLLQKNKSFECQINDVFNRISSYEITPMFSKTEFKGVNISNKYNFKCNTCKNIFEDHLDDGHELICRICHPKLLLHPNKKIETEFHRFLIECGISDVIPNDRMILYPKEIDFYIASKKIAFEINGLYWHSELYKDKTYHIEKTLNLKNKNIRCIHIFEDEWNKKRDILKSKIKHILNVSECEVVYARKCECMVIDSIEKGKFLNTNHIQSNDKSVYNVGAFFKNKLVAVMTFTNPRISLGYVQNKNFIELSRFATDNNLKVVGIASKLFKFATKHFNFNHIISYADIRYTDFYKNVYEKIGFKLTSQTNPNYFWCKNDKRHHRYTFTKHKLVSDGHDKTKTESEIMHSLKYYKIWDCGHFKYEWTS